MSKVQANCLLLLAAAFWGFGNVAQKTVLDHSDASRRRCCLIGGSSQAPLTMLERGRTSGPDYWEPHQGECAVFNFYCHPASLLLGTSVTNASFLVSTATVMTWLAPGS
jgi:hypothetical protein